MSKPRYAVEEVGGTLFLRYGNTVLASNIGEQGSICDIVRTHFELIVKTMNEQMGDGPAPDETPPLLEAP
jgi:hypothetical protein